LELRHDILTHGVNVVCAHHNGRSSGLTVAWATQVAANRILICLGKQSATRDLVVASRAFGLSVLTAQQLNITHHFGTQTSCTVSKLEGVWYHTGETGSPLLDDCAVTLDCRVHKVFDLDSAKLVVGEIVAAEQIVDEYEPLIYHQDDY
jgi:flavin reductase (DIM6/NTAB) family NADH-FMN oxidoreductase RutF